MDFKKKIFDYIRRFVKWIGGSADNDPGGASSKKLTTFWIVVVIITPICYLWAYDNYKQHDWKYITEVLAVLGAIITGTTYLNVKDKKQNEPKQD